MIGLDRDELLELLNRQTSDERPPAERFEACGQNLRELAQVADLSRDPSTFAQGVEFGMRLRDAVLLKDVGA